MNGPAYSQMTPDQLARDPQPRHLGAMLKQRRIGHGVYHRLHLKLVEFGNRIVLKKLLTAHEKVV